MGVRFRFQARGRVGEVTPPVGVDENEVEARDYARRNNLRVVDADGFVVADFTGGT